MKNSRAAALLRVAAAMLIFGTIGIFRRKIGLSSAALACARGLIGSGFLFLTAKVRHLPVRGSAGRKEWLLLALTGMLIGANWILLFEAYSYTTVATATLCYYMEPTFVVLLSALLLRRRLSARKWICVLLALAGMLLVSGVPENGLPGPNELRGILLGLGAALLYASSILLNKRLAHVETYEKTITQLLFAALTMLPYLLLTGDYYITPPDWTTLALTLLVGIVHTGIAYALYLGVMNRLPAETVALFSYIDPVSALLLGWWILGEAMSIPGICGAVLILGAAIVSETGKRGVPDA